MAAMVPEKPAPMIATAGPEQAMWRLTRRGAAAALLVVASFAWDIWNLRDQRVMDAWCRPANGQRQYGEAAADPNARCRQPRVSFCRIGKEDEQIRLAAGVLKVIFI
jgi:hypothetical protein